MGIRKTNTPFIYNLPKTNNMIRWMIIILLVLAVVWLLLSLWAESEGEKKILQTGNRSSSSHALIVYDPDPFYNLDEQVCTSFGKVFADSGWNVTVATVAAAKELTDSSYSLYVFCANTYNWAPDQAISRFIKNYRGLDGKNAVAITLGGGSTKRSQRVLEAIIKENKATLVDSKSLWLWKPNDESRMKEKNTYVAVDIAKKWAAAILEKIK
jgi:hypothetical protein